MMNTRPALLVCSRDEEAVRRLAAAVQDAARIVRAETWTGAVDAIRLHVPFAAVVDVRCDEVFERLDEWAGLFPEVPVIAMGRPRSDRMLLVERVGVFSLADVEDDVRAWQNLMRMAMMHHRMKSELRGLKERPVPAPPPPPPPVPSAPPPREPGAIIQRIAGAFRHFEHMDLMLDRAIEGLASAINTTRAGLFALDQARGRYRLLAGQRYLRETADAEYEAHDPLVRWFEQHAHMMTRTMAGQLQEPDERALLMRSLELFGADIMAPLHARGRLLGWFFVGYRATGQPYALADLEELSTAADYLSMLLENALLYREVTVQKALAETLLHSLPTGIVAADRQGVVRWFSTAAEAMLERKASDVVGRPIEALGARLAHAARAAMQGEAPPAQTWEEAASRRYVQIQARRLGQAAQAEGVVIIMQDLTSIRRMQEREEQMERTAFWTDLAAGLSHEIRNPLVTIRTFAQLLPERYQDEEFREEFSRLVGHEVDRLGGIIDQINTFAHPPDPTRSRVDVRVLLQRALQRIMSARGHAVRVSSSLDGNVPMVQGDERALLDCFSHVFQNAVEALEGRPDAAIRYAVEPAVGAGNEPVVRITIHDNGRGIPEDVKDKVFSPFYTTKARGMGLGLPIVKRTVIDHNGWVNIQPGAPGTRVVIDLPAAVAPAGGGTP